MHGLAFCVWKPFYLFVAIPVISQENGAYSEFQLSILCKQMPGLPCHFGCWVKIWLTKENPMPAVIQIYPHIFVIISLLRHACLAWLHKKCVFSVVTDLQYLFHQMMRLWGGQNTPNLPLSNLFFSTCFFVLTSCADLHLINYEFASFSLSFQVSLNGIVFQFSRR